MNFQLINFKGLIEIPNIGERGREVPSFLIILPAFNVAGYLKKTLKGLKDSVPASASILVVDDGSTDETIQDIEDSEIVLIRHSHNLGKGAALKTGFKFALAHDYDYAIVMDADYQHDPTQIPAFVERMSNGNSDLVVGRRELGPGTMKFDRYLSNQLSSLLLSLICRTRIRDSQCGFRMINLNRLKNLSLISDHYEMESELLIKFARRNASIEQIPIRINGACLNSHIRRGVDTMRFCRMLWRLAINGHR